jgi:hypothetical protein
VEDGTLVINIPQGLNKKYNHVKTYLKQTRSFPSFYDVCNDLLPEELTLDTKASSGLAIALTALGK